MRHSASIALELITPWDSIRTNYDTTVDVRADLTDVFCDPRSFAKIKPSRNTFIFLQIHYHGRTQRVLSRGPGPSFDKLFLFLFSVISLFYRWARRSVQVFLQKPISSKQSGPLSAASDTLAGWWWPYTEAWLVTLWFSKGVREVHSSIPKKTNRFVIFQGGGGQDISSGSALML